jgi:hypothetical protein
VELVEKFKRKMAEENTWPANLTTALRGYNKQKRNASRRSR